MKVRKAVITAAGPDQHMLPLQRLVDRQGNDKSALQMIVEEATGSGVERTCVIIFPGDRPAYREAAADLGDRLVFIEQEHPRGYGDALLRARDFVEDEPFLHLVSDHLYLSREARGCARQLVELAQSEQCAVSAVQATRENRLPFFGAVGGSRVPLRNDLYEVHRVVEKPTPTQAEHDLIVAGLRSGHYLCMFGMHVLTPEVMVLLQDALDKAPAGGSIALSPALAELAQRQRYLALEVNGQRFNIGMKYGLLVAQLAVALSGKDREAIMAELIELLASRASFTSPDEPA